MSGRELSLSWEFDSSASFDCLEFFAAVVGVDCVPVEGASVDDWVHIEQGIAGRRLQRKMGDVHFYLKWRQKPRERFSRAEVVDTHPTPL